MTDPICRTCGRTELYPLHDKPSGDNRHDFVSVSDPPYKCVAGCNRRPRGMAPLAQYCDDCAINFQASQLTDARETIRHLRHLLVTSMVVDATTAPTNNAPCAHCGVSRGRHIDGTHEWGC
jgi:hypothetical protein